MWHLFLDAWAYAIVPSAGAIVAVFAFVKLLLEKQKLQLEIKRLKQQPSSIYQPQTTDEILRYSQPPPLQGRVFRPREDADRLERTTSRLQRVQTTIRVVGVLIAVLLPTSMLLLIRGGGAPDGSLRDLVLPAPVWRGIQFAEGQYRLSDDSKRELDEWAALLQQDKSIRVVIEGYTRSTGTSEENLALGQRRADAVRDYLVSRGVPPSVLRTVSYGEERPQFDNANPETARLNDRVTFSLVKTAPPPP